MSLDAVLQLLSTYGYFILFPLAIVEGPIVTVIAGLLVTTGVFNPFIAYVVVIVGDIVGDSFWYGLGRFGGGHFTRLLERWFGITQEKIQAVKHKLEHHRFKMTAISKLSQGVGFAGMIAAGVVRMSYPLFVFACLLVTLAQCAAYLLLGIFFGNAYNTIWSYLDYAALGTVALVASAIGVFLWYRRRKKKNN